MSNELKNISREQITEIIDDLDKIKDKLTKLMITKFSNNKEITIDCNDKFVNKWLKDIAAGVYRITLELPLWILDHFDSELITTGIERRFNIEMSKIRKELNEYGCNVHFTHLSVEDNMKYINYTVVMPLQKQFNERCAISTTFHDQDSLKDRILHTILDVYSIENKSFTFMTNDIILKCCVVKLESILNKYGIKLKANTENNSITVEFCLDDVLIETIVVSHADLQNAVATM